MHTNQTDELRESLYECRKHFLYAGLFSAAINILLLTPIIYMLTVYDRVVTSGSLSTLSMLTILMVLLLIAVGGFEWVRSAILISAGQRLDEKLRSRVADSTQKRALITGGLISNAQPINDLSALRQFLTGNGLFAFFDAPWFPIYVLVMFLFHPWFGIAGIISGLCMIILAYINDSATSALLKEANDSAGKAINSVQNNLRNSEVIAAMGMSEDLARRQDALFNSIIEKQSQASSRGGALSGVSKAFRLIVQSLLLGLGAYLALNQEISPGMMIAGSLLLGRALAPIDMLVGTWKSFSLAKAQYSRLNELLSKIPLARERMELPSPVGNISVENVSIIPPGGVKPVISGVSFSLNRGDFLGIVGPSAAGKSTLARALIGIWPAYSGKVRLDSADISSWARVDLGPHIGYLPQDIELFEGTISENISRFRDAEPSDIVGAAKLAGVHELILRLNNGYDTVIGPSGGALSGGQRQRIGLARAVFGNPKVLILDEPNSNLDDQGEMELAKALARLKEKGCTTIVITHRSLILQCVDKLLVLKDGLVAGFGPRNEILARLTNKSAATQNPTKTG